MTQLTYVYLAYGFAFSVFIGFGFAVYQKLKRANQALKRLGL